MNRLLSCCLASAYHLRGNTSLADTFGAGANTFEIEFFIFGARDDLRDTPSLLKISIWEKIGNSHLQGHRQRCDDQQRRVSLAALDAPDIRPMVLGPGGKLLLAPTTFLAEFS